MMTYQNTSDSFATNGRSDIAMPTAQGILGFVSSIINAVFESLIKAAEASSRAKQIEVLQGKSDAELAKMGIKRDCIAHHVFNDLYYT